MKPATGGGQQRAQRDRIEFYDLRVKECVKRLTKEFGAHNQAMDVWEQVKLHYIGLLVNHHQPELAETFFNSVTTKILKRAYFQNDFIFVRPAVSTEYIENDRPKAKPTYLATTPRPTPCWIRCCSWCAILICACRLKTWTATRRWCWRP